MGSKKKLLIPNQSGRMESSKILNPYPKVYIIVLYWSNISGLRECLFSLLKVTYPNFNVLVVNNGSDRGLDLTDIDQTSGCDLSIINSPSNLGFAAGNNLGIREALNCQADYILLLNDDTAVSKDFLNILVDIGENNPAVGMLGPKIYYFDDPRRIWFAGAKFDRQTGFVLTPGSDKIDSNEEDEKEMESDYITGCALLVKRKVVEKIGLLDKRFFLYWEDVDWGLSSKKAGFRNLVVPSSKIWHKISISSGGPNSSLKVYHKVRSHFLLVKLHAPDVKWKLMVRFMRDIAWLLFKSTDPDRIKKARAYIAAIIDYHLGKTDRGPDWLWIN